MVSPEADSEEEEAVRGNLIGMFWTVVLVCSCWTVALFIKHKKPISSFRRELARKFVHIGVSNWFFIYACFFTCWIYPVAGLLFFAVVNYFIEIKTGTRRSYGTVYFPLVIIIMIVFKECGFGTVTNVGCGLLGMGYADGLAALIGMKFGKRKMPYTSNKSVIGSLSVMFITAVVILLLTEMSVFSALVIGFLTMLAEAYTPYGLDNFSVPLVIYCLTAVL